MPLLLLGLIMYMILARRRGGVINTAIVAAAALAQVIVAIMIGFVSGNWGSDDAGFWVWVAAPFDAAALIITLTCWVGVGNSQNRQKSLSSRKSSPTQPLHRTDRKVSNG